MGLDLHKVRDLGLRKWLLSEAVLKQLEWRGKVSFYQDEHDRCCVVALPPVMCSDHC